MATTEVVRRRNVVANISRHHPDSPALVEARRDLGAAKIEACVRRTLADAPPPSPDSVRRILALLAGADISGEAARAAVP